MKVSPTGTSRAAERILLVESGPRSDAEALIDRLRSDVDAQASIDVFTCLPDQPHGMGPTGQAWRSYTATTAAERWKTLRELRRERHSMLAILCSDSPILAGWKVVLAGLLPGRILLADKGRRLITLDARHWREAAALAVSRSGLRNPAVLRRLAHAAALPFTICFLLAFAAKVHIGALLRTAASSSDDGSGGQ